MASKTLLCLLLVIVTLCDAKTHDTGRNEHVKAGCSLIYADFPDKEPVFLNSDYSLVEPKVSSIDLKYNEEVLISCPGTKNALGVTGNSLDRAKCVNGENVKIGKQQYNLSELNCTKAIGGEVEETTEVCGNKRGVIKTVGHIVDDGIYDVLFKVCYDDNAGEALYSDNILYGAAIANAKKQSTRPSFKSPGLGPEVPANYAYKQTTQKITFRTLLKSESLASKYINAGSFLARGHLSPDGDFVYVSSSFSSYFYINTVPQWQAVNNGNWKSLEFAVRNTAANLARNLRVITGGYQVLSLNDAKGKPQDMYLIPGQKLPVPKFTWKVVQDTTNNKAIAFVALNNPFIEEMSEKDYLCKNICNQTGWGQDSWGTKPSKGITYCCEVKELKKVINSIPNVKVSGILEATNTVMYKFCNH